MIEHNGREYRDRISLTEASGLCGVTEGAVRYWEREGLVVRGEDKKFDTVDIIRHNESIPKDKRLVGKKSGAIGGRKSGSRRANATPVHENQTCARSSAAASLAESKAQKELWTARRAELTYRREAGELIERSEAEAFAGALGAALQASTMNLIPKLKPYMADAGKAVLETELRAMLAEVARAVEEFDPIKVKSQA